MLSQLSKGYGSWTAGFVDPYFGEKKARERELAFPEIDQDSHTHGITVGCRSGRSTAMSWATSKRSREPTLDGIPLPKTYTTRKGALQLYVGPDDIDVDDNEEDNEDVHGLKPKYLELKRPHGQELIDLSLKLGTMERLAMSVLQFGDQDYDHDHTSVVDAKNKAFLKFLRDVDNGVPTSDVDSTVQPGGDLTSYLRDLKSSNRSGTMNISKSRESMELQAILRGLDNNSNWPLSYSQDGTSDRPNTVQFTRPVSRVSSRGASPGPPSTPRSTYQVLSAKKLCASIKSGSYLGRPSSRVSVHDDDMSETEISGHITSASVTRPTWTPTESTDDFLIDTRAGFYRGEEDVDSDSGKRRGLKERSFLTNNSQLYKGRNARRGDGQRANEVKVIIKSGDGDSQGIRMSQIQEECRDNSDSRNRNLGSNTLSNKRISAKGPNNNSWAEKLSDAKQFINIEVKDENNEELTEADGSGIIDVEINENEAIDKVDVMLSSRRGSNKSDSYYSGSTSTHTPSIITLQSRSSPQKTPVSHEKHRTAYRRRNTYAYDPDKGLIRTRSARRRSENNNDARKNLADFSLLQKAQETQGANRYTFEPGFLHPDQAANNHYNYGWPVHSNNDSDWSACNNNDSCISEDGIYLPDATDETAIDPKTDSQTQQISQLTEDKAITEFVFSGQDNNNQNLQDEIVETTVIDQEEYVLDNVAECNEEIKQIEALAEEIIYDDDSDSGSSMDEELIKVILGGQTDTEVNSDRERDGEELNEHEEVEHIKETEEVEEIKEVIKTDEMNDSEQMKYIEDIENVDGNDNAVEQSISMSSRIGDEDELEVIGKGQVSTATDELEIDRQGGSDETVDEENASEVRSHRSEVRSHRSGHKSRSKKSKSGVGSKSDEEEEVDSTSAEYVLPTLESDHLEVMDEDTQPVSDEQTGFSGSTDQYSDMLDSDKSRPATAEHSRPSSLKLSRPTSASAKSLSGTQVRHNYDQNDRMAETSNKLENVADKLDDNKSNDDYGGSFVTSGASKAVIYIPAVQSKAEDAANEGKEMLELNHEDIAESIQLDEFIDTDGVATSYVNVKTFTGKDEAVKHIVVENKAEEKTEDSINKDGSKSREGTLNEAIQDVKYTKSQPVPKTGKSAAERKTVGQLVPPGRLQPSKTIDNKPEPHANARNKDNKIEHSSKAVFDRTIVEGEGLLNAVSEQASNIDKGSSDGNEAVEHHIAQHTVAVEDNKDAHAIAAELEALGLGGKAGRGCSSTPTRPMMRQINGDTMKRGLKKKKKKKKGKNLTYPLLPPGKRPRAPAQKTKIPDHIADALNRQTDASREYLEQDLERRGFLKEGKVVAMVGESLSGQTLEAVGEGLTEEELELAKQILQQKLEDAKGRLDGTVTNKGRPGKKPLAKGAKKGIKKGKSHVIEEKSPDELDRDAIREKHEQEKQVREEEAAELQKKIAEKQQMLKEQNDLTSARSQELKEEMGRLEREAEAIQRAQDEAREILADVRKKQREERETRRKADLERKKAEAVERREREKKEMDVKRRKEMEMMEKIADAEMRRRMREEEERRIDEEERLAQERYEEEMKEALRLEEEEEEKMKELERQAEEEAMQRLIDEHEAAERERRRLRDEEEAMRESENLKMLAMEEEQQLLEGERRRMQEAEEAKREAERQRLQELLRLEEEVRMQMQEEIEKRRMDALSRRDCNLENKVHVDKLRHNQGITKSWTFSYFVHWPRETYEREIGAGDPRKIVKIKNPKPKQKDEAAESGEATAAGVP